MNCKEIFDNAFSAVTPLSDTDTVLMNVKERAGKMKTNDGFERKELHEITVHVPEKKPTRKAPLIAGVSLFAAAAAGFGIFAWNTGTYHTPDSLIYPAASSQQGRGTDLSSVMWSLRSKMSITTDSLSA